MGLRLKQWFCSNDILFLSGREGTDAVKWGVVTGQDSGESLINNLSFYLLFV